MISNLNIFIFKLKLEKYNIIKFIYKPYKLKNIFDYCTKSPLQFHAVTLNKFRFLYMN